jgi:hypothetical protein
MSSHASVYEFEPTAIEVALDLSEDGLGLLISVGHL